MSWYDNPGETQEPKRSPTMDETMLDRAEKALRKHRGFVARAADELNISRDTLHRWIKNNKPLARLVKTLRKNR